MEGLELASDGTVTLGENFEPTRFVELPEEFCGPRSIGQIMHAQHGSSEFKYHLVKVVEHNGHMATVESLTGDERWDVQEQELTKMFL